MIFILIFGFLRWSSVSAFRYQRDREQQCATLYVDVRTYLNQTCKAWWDQRTCNWTIATALVTTSPSLSVSAPVVQVGWKGGRRSILYDPTPDSPTSNQKISSEFFYFKASTLPRCFIFVSTSLAFQEMANSRLFIATTIFLIICHKWDENMIPEYILLGVCDRYHDEKLLAQSHPQPIVVMEPVQCYRWNIPT